MLRTFLRRVGGSLALASWGEPVGCWAAAGTADPAMMAVIAQDVRQTRRTRLARTELPRRSVRFFMLGSKTEADDGSTEQPSPGPSHRASRGLDESRLAGLLAMPLPHHGSDAARGLRYDLRVVPRDRAIGQLEHILEAGTCVVPPLGRHFDQRPGGGP